MAMRSRGAVVVVGDGGLSGSVAVGGRGTGSGLQGFGYGRGGLGVMGLLGGVAGWAVWRCGVVGPVGGEVGGVGGGGVGRAGGAGGAVGPAGAVGLVRGAVGVRFLPNKSPQPTALSWCFAR